MDSNILLKKLNEWGCDTKGALSRVLDDEELYVSLLVEYKDTFRVDYLKEMIEKKDIEEAFSVAHELKGTLGNLGLTPLYSNVCEIVDVLRNGSLEGLEEKADKLIKDKEHLDKLIEE